MIQLMPNMTSLSGRFFPVYDILRGESIVSILTAFLVLLVSSFILSMLSLLTTYIHLVSKSTILVPYSFA